MNVIVLCIVRMVVCDVSVRHVVASRGHRTGHRKCGH